ncbi:MAG TPA: helicase-related protein [Gaiellaceae bacterium]|jgi:superfamily II DNA or RNA helicase|nr:helicase-related protein [Gaiellaceae bacterium]
MSFAPGSLVATRGREWVVLPDSTDDLLVLRPLGGTDDEVAGVLTALEEVKPAQFDLPDPNRLGDATSARLLRDALRLSSRAGAGPFRSFARIAVEPRPYQLVPLLMALKLDPVRLLVADDVGIGKTVEALLVARELLDQGDANGLTVICPPHLAEQWQAEMADKFHLDAELVLAGTAARLERGLRVGESLFERHPITVVSLDYIKSDRRRDDFIRACPNLVIVDEAHTCADAQAGRGHRHQRYELVSKLAANEDRHLLLVTATPHSGNDDAFQSLVSFLDPTFRLVDDELDRDQYAAERRRLSHHLVQRRRGDILHYLGETSFPNREVREETYELPEAHRRLFKQIFEYGREKVGERADGSEQNWRMRWWSILGIMRALSSSPAAAAATLDTRADLVEEDAGVDLDELARRIFDATDDESAEGGDLPPSAALYASAADRRALKTLREAAQALTGDDDPKVQQATKHVRKLLDDGFNPIVFCAYVPTAEYVAEHLRAKLPKDVEVIAVTGRIPAAEREQRVLSLEGAPRRVLVATDCLSEGVNMQRLFDAVVHYDLAWNPTRHEQREGRVDRYGQPSETVRVLTYFGRSNAVDGVVLDVLQRKNRTIHDRLGISVPVPVGTREVLDAIFEGLVLRGRTEQLSLFDMPELVDKRDALHDEWDAAADREKRSRTIFAQQTIEVDEVARELDATRAAIGSATDVARFVTTALRAAGATVSGDGEIHVDLRDTPLALRDAVGRQDDEFRARFELPVPDEVEYLSRTHPLVDALAGYIADTSLDPLAEALAARCGVMRTDAVATRTTLLLVRMRFDVITRRGGEEGRQLAEETRLLAFVGDPTSPTWLDDEEAAQLLGADPSGNVAPEQARELVAEVVGAYDMCAPALGAAAESRAQALLDAHERVREGARMKGVRYLVEPQPPVDLLGSYVLLPRPSL